MAAPRPKKTVVKKKPPVKKKPSFLRKDTPRPARDPIKGARAQFLEGPKKPDVKSPAETRRSISRKQTGTSRPARDVKPGDLRDKALKEAQANARSATAPKPTKTSLLRSVGSRVFGALGAIVDPSFMSNEYGGAAGPGSDKPVGSVMKSNMPGGYGSKTSGYGPTPKKKASGFGERISEGAKFERLRASRAALGSKSSDSGSSSSYSGYGNFNVPKASAGSPFPKGKGNAALPKVKSGSSKAASVTPAAGSSGTSQATKKKSRSPTRYQRNETAMEQRKSSSGKPKKSIFSLFRKG